MWGSPNPPPQALGYLTLTTHTCNNPVPQPSSPREALGSGTPTCFFWGGHGSTCRNFVLGRRTRGRRPRHVSRVNPHGPLKHPTRKAGDAPPLSP